MKKRSYGSLARRVLLVCLVLIIFPLLVHGFLVWDRDWRVKLDSVFSDLDSFGKFSTKTYEQWLSSQESYLTSLQLLLEDKSHLSKVNNLFVFDSSLQCIASSGDRCPPLPKQLKKVGVFAHSHQVFLLKRIGEEIWGLSVEEAAWIQMFLPKDSPFRLRLVDKLQEKSGPNVQVFTPLELAEWEKERGIWEAYRLKGKDLALRIPLPEALFDLQIEMGVEEVEKVEGAPLFSSLLHFLLFFLLLGGIAALWLIRKMAHPFHQLYRVMDAVEHNNYSERYKSEAFGFEINELGKNFNRMLESLLHQMEQTNKEQVARELLSQELQIGHQVQKQLFPKEKAQFPGIIMGSGFLPAKEVGGDFYDLFVKDRKNLLLAIADGSDKGISACLYSLIVRSMLRSYVLAEENLAEAIRRTNHLFCQDTGDTGNFVTAWIGLYQAETGLLTYSSAGHLPAILLYPDGRIEELSTGGIALGVSESFEIEVKTKTLDPDTLLILYTDGLTEAHNKKGELFGKSRLFHFLRVSSTLPPQELIDMLLLEVGQFAQEVPQHDDLMILSIKTLKPNL